MSARSRPKPPSPLARALVALATLALALLAFGADATTARADGRPQLKVTSYYGDYDGQPHSASVSVVGENTEGYYLEFYDAQGNKLPDSPSRTEVGIEEFYVYLLDTEGTFALFTNFYISIGPRNVTVTITGDSQTFVYDGDVHTAEGYTVDSIAVEPIDGLATPAYTEADFLLLEGQEAKAAGTDAGSYPMHLFSIDFYNLNGNFEAEFKVTDGTLTIGQRPVDVYVTGATRSVDYDGREHSVEGYTSSWDDQLFTEDDWGFDGTAYVAATDPGTHAMGLSAEQFSSLNGNFAPTFHVTDGSLAIAKAKDVEPTDDVEPTEPATTDGGGATKDVAAAEPAAKAVPQTGDATDPSLPAALAAAGALALGSALARRRGEG